MSELDEATFNAYRPDGVISSLRRVQALYGAIAEAQEAAERGGERGEFGLYLTPGELDEFISSGDDDRYLVAVKIDLTSETPTLADVEVRPLREELVSEIGFSRYPWGRGIDNSITRRGAKGGSNASTATRYCVECLQRWTNGTGKEEAVGELAEDHPDGWVIDELRTVGSRDGTEERIEELIDAKYPPGNPRVVATVGVNVPTDQLERSPDGDPDEDGYYYPGQIHVLNAGMRARKEEKLARKNLPDTADPSVGEGTCMVTGQTDQVFGTAEDPLAFFTVQHAEKFPSLSKSNSWRTHPISSEAGLLLQSGASLLDACSETRNGLRVYTIPYFLTVDVDRAQWLYEAVNGETAAMSHLYDDIQEGYFSDREIHDLRFYIIGVRDDSGDINVLFEIPDAMIYWPTEVAKAHEAVLDPERSTSFSSTAGFAPDENWYGISPSTGRSDYVESITNGLYAFGTLPDPGADAPPTDDPREWLTTSILTGDPVNVDRLLSEYVTRLEDERRDEQPIGRLVRGQYAQFEALGRADLLNAPGDRPELEYTVNDMNVTRDGVKATDGGIDSPELLDLTEFDSDSDPSFIDIRRHRLQRFLEERSALRENDERRGAFLAGVLVGQLSDHQATPERKGGRGMSRTIRDRHPPEQMNGTRLARIYTGDLERLPRVYGRETGIGPLFPETQNELRDAFAEAKPNEWNLPINDLRFFYALGIQYGSSAGYQARQLGRRVGVFDETSAGEE